MSGEAACAEPAVAEPARDIAAPSRRLLGAGLLALMAGGLAGCGGGSSDEEGGTTATATPSPTPTPTPTPTPGTTAVPSAPQNDAEAVRFLNQATFGATDAMITDVKTRGYSGWIDNQMAMAIQHNHVSHVEAMAARVTSGHWVNRPQVTDVSASMWIGMMKEDQLRQRVMFGLSQIFVVSIADGATYYQGTGLAAYVDMLYKNCFGNWRTLIEQVTRATAMGCYLAAMYNRKEDPTTGTQPDQNYAREVMQLFSIGLWQLNDDGSRKLDSQGQPIPTYTTDDIAGVSRVMTGFAYDVATTLNWNQFYGFWDAADMPVQARPMKGFPAYHSTSEKKFLGVTIPASTTGDPDGDLKILLDTLYNHPNTPPFFCRQMIQRLVTSNPSAAYIQRVVSVFKNDGNGVRGNLAAVIKAILTDSEARNDSSITWDQFGRAREQIIRMLNVMRIFKARTDVDPLDYNIPLWAYDVSKGLWQTPLNSPSVFNFYLPDYGQPNSDISARGLTSPELQIVTASSVGDTWRFLLDILQNGGITSCCSTTERNTYSLRFDYSDWLPLVSNPGSVADKLNRQFMAGQMSAGLRQAIIDGMNARYRGISETSGVERGVDQIKLAEAISFMLLSPEYVIQK